MASSLSALPSSSSSATTRKWLLLIIFSFSFLYIFPHRVFCECKNRRPIIFNFGDSNSDTGGLVAGLGYPVTLPNGRTFFHRSTGRLSDGRLLIDFLCESLNASYLRPYLEALGAVSTFSNGANFAVVGSSTLPKYVPFALNVQIMQFLHFRSRSSELLTQGSTNMINDGGFRSALYLIDIGQNDLADSFSKKLSFDQVTQRIPSILNEIKNAIQVIYDQGGRRFWVHNTGPLGCLPQKLSLLHPSSKSVDPHGCLSDYNSAANLFNQGLRNLCDELRADMRNVTIVYVDIYAIKYDLIANAIHYGFASPLMACCGFGGPPYNYNINVTCGHSGSQVCEEGSRYISWDGIHYTEMANAIVASKVLSASYSTPPLAFDFFCN